jgi:hypothetical protein
MGGKKLCFLVITSILIIFSAIASYAQDQPGLLISNSANWQDVYSVMQFSAISGSTGYFLVSTRHSTLLINQLSPKSKILIVSSSDNPYVVGYKSVLQSRGFGSVDEIRIRNVNLELAKRLSSDVTNFIITDDSYGYNAISLAPYAAYSKSYVIFADRRSISQVTSFLSSRTVNSIIIYGQVDREVKDALSQYNPETINEGDRFLDNQKIVDKYEALYKKNTGEYKQQAVLTNGEFIEQEIMSGVEPVVFIGRANVPDQVKDYIKQSNIDIGILIGNELVGSATLIRRDLGISVFVKFAQSARAPSSAISPVEDLDRFYLPRYALDLDIYRISYNRLARQVEITYQNKVALSSYLKGTITLRYDGGTQVLGDEQPVFIDKSQYKTIIYTIKSDGGPIDPMQGTITADIFTIFGESKNSLEYTLRKTVEVETIDIQDNSKIEFGKVLYDKRSGKFLIEIRNTGDVDVFVDLELIDLLINDELVTLGSEKVAFIRKGESIFMEVVAGMDDKDLEANPKIKVRAYYGERERSLVHILEGEFPFEFTGFGYLTGQVLKDIGKNALLAAPILLIIILLLLILGMKKKCPVCGEINNLRAKRCKNCGSEI